MSSPESARAAYVARVNAVIDHIEGHLDEELTVEGLAAVAHFSPYHFHRVFSSITGETLGGFIGRLRLERAANRLVAQRERPVTVIALESGFASPSAFSRAFRTAYGTTPSQWRAGGRRRHRRRSQRPHEDPTMEGLASSGDFGIRGVRYATGPSRTAWEIVAGALGRATVELEAGGRPVGARRAAAGAAVTVRPAGAAGSRGGDAPRRRTSAG